MAGLGAAVGGFRSAHGFAKVGVENVGSDFALSSAPSSSCSPLGSLEWQSPSSVSGCSYAFLYFRASPPGRPGYATSGSFLDAACVAPIDKLSVVLVAVLGVTFLGERLSGPNWLGVALIAAGATFVAYNGWPLRAYEEPAWTLWWGNTSVLTALPSLSASTSHRPGAA